MSPREVFIGRKINYKKELTLGFGDFCKVNRSDVKSYTMQSRTLDTINYSSSGL